MQGLSLFSGIGGLCEGFKLAGFDVLGAVEQDKYACESYRANFPNVPLFEGDVQDFMTGSVEEQHLKEMAAGGGIEVVFGGPPCQGYSQIGPRDVSDPRNALYKEFCRIVRAVRPKFVIIENVPNMFLMNKGKFKDDIFEELRNSGYGNIGWVKLDASNYGVPQARNRIFVLACPSEVTDFSSQYLLDETAQSLTRTAVNVDDAIGDLPKTVAPGSGQILSYDAKDILSSYQKEMRLDQVGEFYDKSSKTAVYNLHQKELALHNHHTKEIGEKRLALIKLLAQGAKANSLPKEVWNRARPEKWRRFDPKKPAHTLLAQMHRDLSEWIHPHHDRWITVREALRLQSFHDGFVLKTSEWQQLKQVGNAVPPLLGFVPAMAVRLGLALQKGEERPFEPSGQASLSI
ncbi:MULTISPECIES: DNA cytosine methyltransferase [unclassified Ruegeria]|uniref:DNA cytosine methyltransferase n=1 Tax=unclassified Ruegeria TaxID=2625375 RepID=UPI0014885E6C|nr:MULTISPECIES: DNA cytosine methyltransferase [unclassified Ruegeria]